MGVFYKIHQVCDIYLQRLNGFWITELCRERYSSIYVLSKTLICYNKRCTERRGLRYFSDVILIQCSYQIHPSPNYQHIATC